MEMLDGNATIGNRVSSRVVLHDARNLMVKLEVIVLSTPQVCSWCLSQCGSAICSPSRDASVIEQDQRANAAASNETLVNGPFKQLEKHSLDSSTKQHPP